MINDYLHFRSQCTNSLIHITQHANCICLS